MDTLEKIIYEFADNNDLLIGICDAKPLCLPEYALQTGDLPFVSFTEAERTDPKLSLPSAESIIVIGAGYKKNPKKPEDEQRGTIAAFAAGKDYHTVLKELLCELRSLLSAHRKFECLISVDTGALPERELAKKAGLGHFGKNRHIIGRKFGSFFNIGYMLTDLPLSPSFLETTIFDPCDGCNLCVCACPGHALCSVTSRFAWERCASYISQKKGDLNTQESEILGDRLYGCDVCINICPHNANVLSSHVENIDEIYPKIKDLSAMNKSEFSNRFSRSALFWVGKNVIIRNSHIAALNAVNKSG